MNEAKQNSRTENPTKQKQNKQKGKKEAKQQSQCDLNKHIHR